MYIDGKDYDKLFEKIDDFFGNPFFLFDSSFRLFSTSWKNKISEKYLKEYNNTRILTDEILNELKKNGDLELIKNNDEVAIKNYSNFKSPIMFRRISDSKYTYGYLCLYAKNKEFSSEDGELLDLMCKIALHILKDNGYDYKTDYVVFSQIIDGILKEKKEIDRILDNLNLEKKISKRLMLVKTNKAQQLSTYLNSKDNDCKVFEHNGNIVCFVADDRKKVNSLIKDFIKEIDDSSIQVGVSDVFNNYIDLAEFYKQALESIEIGNKFIKENSVHFAEDYKALSIINKLSDDEIEAIIDDRVKQIIKYDKENETNYLNDIEIYFKSGRNINKASKMLFIHKNSMYYRMDKIREIFGLDLENENDCFNIELSLKLLRLLEKDNIK